MALGAALAFARRPRPDPPSGASLYNLELKWTTQAGATVALGAFAGRPAIVAMGYTTCKDICPAIVADMMWVEKHLPPGSAEKVRFAFFSFDSEADTPERLTLYAESHGLDLVAGRSCGLTRTRCASSPPPSTSRSVPTTRTASITPPSFRC